MDGRFRVVLLIASMLSSSFGSGNGGNGGDYHHLDLDGHSHGKLAWRVDSHAESIEFRITVTKHATLVGFGFSDYGESENADLVFLQKNSESSSSSSSSSSSRRRYQATDCRTDEHGVILADPENLFVLHDTDEDDSTVTFSLSRKLRSCKPFSYQIDRGTTHIIFVVSTSWSRGEPLTGKLLSTLHPQVRLVQLIKSEHPLPELPSDTEVFDVTANNIKIPSATTTYWCTTIRLPQFESKRHIVKMVPIITAGNEMNVHHMEVFHCEYEQGAAYPDYHAPCNSEDKPKELQACRKVLAAWAMGAEGLTYPAEAGLPIGGSDFYPVVVLETHYNNPSQHSDLFDSSGIRFYVTRNLRRFDVGIMELGLDYTPKNSIPPGVPGFWLAGFCPSRCTQVALRDEIFVFASQLHTHERGRKVITHHIRDGLPLPDLNRDDHYSPHFQEIRLLPRPVQIKPGDSLITRCEYRTIGIANVTLGGIAGVDEMCVNYIHYYPKSDLELCKSSIADADLNRYFRFMHDWALDEVSPTESIPKNYNSIKWTPLSTFLLEQLYEMSDISVSCNNSAGNRFLGQWKNLRPPTFVELKQKKPSKC